MIMDENAPVDNGNIDGIEFAYGYGVRRPYISNETARIDGNAIVFVGNGDGTGELYAANMVGLPVLDQQLGGIKPKEGMADRFIAYDTAGNEEEPMSADDAYNAIITGFVHDGVIIYQAIKTIKSDNPTCQHAVSIRKIGDEQWQVIEYGTVDDEFGGWVQEFNNAYHRQIQIVNRKPVYRVRVLKYGDVASMKHVLLAM